MADEYDAYFGGTATRAKAPARDPYDAYFDDEKRTAAAINLHGANRGNPDQAARAVSLARETALPVETVERNLIDVDAQARLAKQRQAMQRDPFLAIWAAVPENAKVGADDFPLLERAAKPFRQVAAEARARREGREAVADAARPDPTTHSYFRGVGRSLIEGGAKVGNTTQLYIADMLGLRNVQSDLLAERDRIDDRISATTPRFKSAFARDLYSGVSSTAQMLPGLLGSIATGSPTLALASAGGLTFGDAYGRYRARGGTAGEALAGGAGEAAVEIATEKLPVGYLVDTLGKVGFGRFMAGFLGREMAGEQLATFAQDAIDTAIANPDKTWGEFWAERPEAAKSTAVAVAAMAGTMAPLQIAAEMDQRRAKVSQAETDAQFLTDLAAGVVDSKTRGRDASAFARFLALHAEDTPVEKLYIPAERIAEFYQSERIDWNADDPYFSFQPDFAEQMAQGLATGGDVVINTADFAAHLAGSPAWEALSEDIRARSDGLSLREAKSFAETYADFIEQRGREELDAAEAERAASEPAQQVFDRVVSQLREAGVAPDAANQYAALYAARYATRAERLGTDALTEFERSNVSVRAEMPEAVAAYTKADNLDLLINAMRRGKQPPAKRGEPSLVEFIAKRGGITDPGGDLASMGAGAWHKGKPGKRKLLKDAPEGGALPGMGQGAGGIGFSPDDVAMAAWEAGYFPDLAERPDVATLLEAIGRELGGAPVYPAADTTRDADEAVQGAIAGLEAVLTAAGLDPATATAEQIKAAVEAYEQGRSYEQSAAPGAFSEQMAAAVADQYPGVELDVSDNGITATISRIVVPEGQRDSGTGTKVMELLTAAADEAGIRLALTPDGSFGGSVKRLRQFYKRFGFVENKGRSRSFTTREAMVRNPPGREYEQSARGKITFAEGRTIIHLFEGRDLSTFLHESGHLWLEELVADASLDDAPQQLKDDLATVLAWFGVSSPAEIGTEHHEQWARGVERYLMEGRAPSAGLRRAFDAFRSWLLRIYQAVQNLRTPLSDEIRSVMDRLVATDLEIEAARQAQNMRALFKDAATAGMTDAEFAEYLKAVTDGREEAHDALLYRTMEAVRRRRTKEWREEEARVRGDVTARIDRRPEFKALHLLRTGRMLGGDPEAAPVKVKLDRQVLVDLYGTDALSMLPKGVPPLVADEGGVDPDTLAEMVGATSGDELIRTLMGVETRTRQLREAGDKRSVRQVLIDEEAAAEMLDRHGDVLNDGSIEEEARAAVYGERQGEVIAAETRALSRRTGNAPTPLSIARAWARRVVAESSVREAATPAALNRYSRAAAKAARAAEAAILAGDVDEAHRQKQAQLLNHALFMEAKAAAEEVDAAVKRLGKLARRATSPSIDQAYLDQAHGLLEKFNFRAVSRAAAEKREALAVWIAAQQAAGVDVAEATAALDRMGGKSYQLMSVEDLRGLNDAVMQIVHLGRLKKKLLDAKEQREFDAVVDEAVASIEATPQRKPSNNMSPSVWDKVAGALRSVDVALIKVEAVLDWLDGGKPGVFRRVIWDRFRGAQDRERAMLADYTARLEALLRTVPKEQVRGWLRKVETPELRNRETGEAWQLTKDQVVAIALNTGNEGNLQRLLDGYGWSEAAVQSVLDRVMTAADWAYVQGVWDTIDTLWPEIAALEKRLNGVEPDRVEAREVATPHGTFRGGYYPVVYDPLKDLTAARQSDASGDALFENSYTRATTPKGFTKARADKVARPILLSLGVIQRHVGEVIHDLAWREAVIDADRLLSDKRVAGAVSRALGPEYAAMFRPWLQNIANEWARDSRTPSAVEAFAKGLRARATMVGLGLRLSTILQQPIGYANVIEVIGEKWALVGLGKWARNPAAAWRFVTERSPEMRGRFDSLDRDIRENIKRYAGQKSIVGDIRRFAFYGIGYADLGVTVPAWLGAWNKAQAEGMTEDEAASYADGVVTRSQGAGAAKDLSEIMRGNQTSRLFTMFYSFFSAQYARQRTLARDATDAVRERRVQDFPRLLARTFWLAIVPTLASAWVSGDEPGEEEDGGLWALQKIIFGNMASLPVVRDITNYFDRGFGYTMSPASRAFETGQKAISDAVAAVSPDDEPSEKWLKNAVETAGYALKLPLGQAAATAQFLSDVIDGDQQPETVADWYEGLAKGRIED